MAIDYSLHEIDHYPDSDPPYSSCQCKQRRRHRDIPQSGRDGKFDIQIGSDWPQMGQI